MSERINSVEALLALVSRYDQPDELGPFVKHLIQSTVAGGSQWSGGFSGHPHADALSRLLSVPASRSHVRDEILALRGRDTVTAAAPLLVTGPAGTGKTYLIGLLRSDLEGGGDWFMYDKSPQSGRPPLSSVQAAVRSLASTAATKNGVSDRSILSQALRAADLPGTGMRAVRAVWPELIPDGETDEPTGDVIRDEHLLAFLRSFLKQLSFRTVVVCLDDLQWIDEPSLRLFLSAAEGSPRLRLLLIGRPEAEARVSPEIRRCAIRLDPLDPEELLSLQNALAELYQLPGEEIDSIQRPLVADPTPLGVSKAVHNEAMRGRISQALRSQPDARTERTAHQGNRALLNRLALLSPPVPVALLYSVFRKSGIDVDDAVDDAVASGVLQRTGDGNVAFVHDTTETAALGYAVSDSAGWRDVLTMLASEPTGALDRQRYGLAGVLATWKPDLPDGVKAQAVWLLRGAARIALDGGSVFDAKRFAAEGLRLTNMHGPRGHRIAFHLIAHEAAYRAGDIRDMSRHFRFIHHFGNRVAVNTARSVWVTMSYAQLRIPGALSIGKTILRDLSPRDRLRIGRFWLLLMRRSGSVFVYMPLFLLRVLLLPPSPSRSRDLLLKTCREMIFSVFTVTPGEIIWLARICLASTLRSGMTAHAPLAPLLWSMGITFYGGPRWLASLLSKVAVRLCRRVEARRIGSAYDRYASFALVSIFGLSKDRDYPRLIRRYDQVQRRGLELGHLELATHAANLGAQFILLSGNSLSKTREILRERGERARELHVVRTAWAIAKFEQLAECLQTPWERPSELSGTVFRAQSELERLQNSGDTLGVAGFGLIRSILATFVLDAERAVDLFRETWRSERRRYEIIYDTTSNAFLHALSALRVGALAEAKSLLRYLRRARWATPGRHRFGGLSSCLALAAGRSHAALRLGRRSISRALANGFDHEAGLLAEFLGDHWPPTGTAGSAREWYMIAAQAYAAWGFAPGVERVNAPLSPGTRIRVPGETPENGPTQVRQTHGLQLGRSGSDRHADADAIVSVLSVVNSAVILIDDEGLVQFWNLSAEPFIDWDSSGTRTLRPELWNAVRPLTESPSVVNLAFDQEVSLDQRHWRVTVAPVASFLFAVSLENVTELRERDEQLIVSDRLNTMNILTAAFAHEVGNASYVMGLSTQALVRKLEAQDNRSATHDSLATLARRIEESSKQINAIVSRVRAYGRYNKRGNWTSCDPVTLVENLTPLLEAVAAHYTNRFTVRSPSKAPAVRIREGHLEQALLNLVKNACEALTDREQEVAVELSVEPHGQPNGAVTIRVCDQGRGVPVSHLAGKRPETPLTSEKAGGSGLGLPVVRAIVAEHGGTFHFRFDERYTTIAEIVLV